MEDWIDATTRLPQEGEIIELKDLNGRYEVRGLALFNARGKLAIPICLVEHYKICKH